MIEAIVSTKGQVVIPQVLREQFNLKPGAIVLFDVSQAAIRITPKKSGATQDLDMGPALFGYCGPTIALDAMRVTDDAHYQAETRAQQGFSGNDLRRARAGRKPHQT